MRISDWSSDGCSSDLRAFQARITGREKRDQRLAAGCTKLGDAGIDSVHGVAVREWKILPGCCCVRRDIDTSGQSIGSAKNAKNAKNATKMFATESLNKSPDRKSTRLNSSH